MCVGLWFFKTLKRFVPWGFMMHGSLCQLLHTRYLEVVKVTLCLPSASAQLFHGIHFRGVGAVAAGPAMAAPLLVEDRKIKNLKMPKNEEKKDRNCRPPRSNSCTVQSCTCSCF